MSRSPRTFPAQQLSLGFVFFALLGALASPGLGFQTKEIQDGPGAPPSSTDVTQLPADTEAMKKLKTAQEYIDAKLYNEAARLLQSADALDRGEFDLAAVCYRRLLDAKDKPTKATLFKAALAFHYAGNGPLEKQTLAKLENEIGNGNFKVGARQLSAEQLRGEIARL